MPTLHDARGQATVEFVALLPLLIAAALACWQLVLAGHAAWSAAAAARAAARAHAVGSDARAAARRVLPASLDGLVRVRAGDDAPDRVTVRLRVPAIVPGLDIGTLASTATFAAQR